jgi:hypothetical protein
MAPFRILLDALPPAGAQFTVPPEQAHHLRAVLRVLLPTVTARICSR